MEEQAAINFLDQELEKQFRTENDATAFLDEKPESKLQKVGEYLKPAYRTLENIGQVYPVAEAGLNLLSMTYGLPISGLAGIAGLPFGKGEEMIELAQKALIYQPQTKRGQELTEAMFYPITTLEEKVAKPTGDYWAKKAGPAAGAAAYAGVMALPILIGAKRAKGKQAGPKPKAGPKAPPAVESQFAKEKFTERFLEEKPKISEVVSEAPTIITEKAPARLPGIDERISEALEKKGGPQKVLVSEKEPVKPITPPERTKEALRREPYSYEGESYTTTETGKGKWKVEPKEGYKEDVQYGLEGLAGDVARGEPGKKIQTPTGEWTGYSSTYPAFMNGMGWTGKEVVTALEKGAKGEPLGKRQAGIVEAALDHIDALREASEAQEAGFTLFSGLPITKVADFWQKDVGGLLWDKGVMKGIPALLEKVPGGKSINRAFLYDYRGNLPRTQDYIKSLDDMKRFQAVGREYAIDLGKRLQSLSEETQLKIGEYITTKKPTVELTGQALEYAQEAKQVMLDLGRQAVDAGLLSEKTFFKNAGQYMPRLYTSKEYQTLLTQYGLRKPNRLDLSRFKRRKDIPKEIRQEMGEILTPGYPIAKGVAQLTHDIELARFFNGIARNKDWAIPKEASTGMYKATIPEGFKLIEGKKLGRLSEAYVHPEIFKDLQQTIKVMEAPERIWRKALGSWKFGKVIVSPKTHVRNLMSNSVLAHLGGLPMYEQPIYLTKAARAMVEKGDYWRFAKEEGLLRETFTNAELRSLFDRVEGQIGDIKAQSLPEALGKIGSAWGKTKAGLGKAAKLYEAEEQWFKMGKFIHNVERKKMGYRAAAADAEKWLFNYSKVTRFQESYRSKWFGAPFATFTFKALPRIAEAMIKTPWRFALPASIIYGLEMAAQKIIGDSREEIEAKKELRKNWMKGSFLGIPNFARVPFIDEDGREYYLNLTYILPWGDLGEGGNFGPIPGALMPFSQPFVKEPWQQFANYNNFWKENIVKSVDIAGLPGSEGLETEPEKVFNPLTEAGRKALGIRGKQLGQSLLPTPVIDIAKGYSSLKGTPDYKGRFRPKTAVALDVFTGIKMYPVDYVERTMQEIARLDPSKGYLAREIHQQIETYAQKKQATQKRGGNTEFYEKKIQAKIKQLEGLAEQARKTGKRYKKAKGK